jgi:hypothetical protein
LDILLAEIRRIKAFQTGHQLIETYQMEIEKHRQFVPDNPCFERLIRYEAHLDRAIERTQTQLERTQRMRKGQLVPPPIKLDVSS